MRVLAAYGGAAVGVLRRDVTIFTTYRISFATQIASTLLSVVLFYYISRLVTIGDFAGPDEYFAYALVGILTLDVVNTAAVLVPTQLRQELVMGTFERLVLSPFGAVASAASMMLFPFAWSMLKTSIVLVIAAVFFDLPIVWPQAVLALPVAALATLSFAPFGLLVGALVLVMKQALGITSWLVAGLSLVAGFYFPVALLPDWIQWMSEVQPFTPTIELMRHVLVGTPMTDPVWIAVAKLIGFAIVLAPLGVWVLSKAVRQSRRRGTIIEY